MGIGQISVSSFAPAYPYGPPRSDLQDNMGAIAAFARANQEVQKQRYENQLLKALLGIGLPPAKSQSGLASMAGGPPPVNNPADALPVPSMIGATPGFVPPSNMPTPQPAAPVSGLASLAAPGGIPIPEIMNNRFNPPPQQGGLRGILSNIGNAFNPNGQYRGAPTQIESMLFGERLKQLYPEKITPYQQESINIEKQKLTKTAPAEWKPTTPAEFAWAEQQKKQETPYQTQLIEMQGRRADIADKQAEISQQRADIADQRAANQDDATQRRLDQQDKELVLREKQLNEYIKLTDKKISEVKTKSDSQSYKTDLQGYYTATKNSQWNNTYRNQWFDYLTTQYPDKSTEIQRIVRPTKAGKTGGIMDLENPTTPNAAGKPTGTVKIRRPDGQTGTIPAENLQAAIAAGYTQIK